MATKQEQATYQGFVDEGFASIHAPNGSISGYPSSTHYDIQLLTWHVVYWTGRRPYEIRPSREHSYLVKAPSVEFTARIADYNDHRRGIEGSPLGA